MLNITDKSVEDKIPPVLRLGFRPFFLLGSIYAIIAVTLWVYMFQNGQFSQLSMQGLWWHVHEMLFGFSMAIVAGFVLTAVQTWTGVNGTKHHRLAVLVVLWLLPRILFWTPTPLWLIATIEVLFLLSFAYEVGFRVYRSKGWRNLFFVPLILLAILVDLASYASVSGMISTPAIAIWQGMLWWFALLLSIMGGRVIAFFSAKRFQFSPSKPIKWLEWAASGTLCVLLLLSFFPEQFALYSQPIMIIAGLVQLVRFLRWKPYLTLSEPLVWSLHAAYACLPISLLLRGLLTDAFAQHAMLHLFAVGALGGLILAMIARVTMGHTGRAIYKGPSMWLAFAAIIICALLRSVGVGLWPQYMMPMLNISTALWVFAFGMYVIKFGKMLLTARVDGHPG